MSSYDFYHSSDKKKLVFDTGERVSLFELTFWLSNWSIRIKRFIGQKLKRIQQNYCLAINCKIHLKKHACEIQILIIKQKIKD